MNLTHAGIGFTLGLAGSLHCLGMCGPMALAVGATGGQAPYHAGRIVTYSLLGAIAGALGGAISAFTRYQNAAAVVAGAAMILAAIYAGRRPLPIPLTNIQKRSGRLLLSPLLHHKLGFGLMMGLLPCGMIYAALLAAAGAGNWAAGAATMAAFGIATTGPLLAASLLAGPRLRQWAPRLTPLALALLGVVMLWRGLMPGGMAGHVHHH